MVRILSLLSLGGGLLAISMPALVADTVGLAFEVGATGTGYAEIGALYGGNFVALGLVGLWAARAAAVSGPQIVVAIGVVWLGIAGGRLATPTRSPWGTSRGRLARCWWRDDLGVEDLMCRTRRWSWR